MSLRPKLEQKKALQQSVQVTEQAQTVRLDREKFGRLRTGYGYNKRAPKGWQGNNAADNPLSARGNARRPGTYWQMPRRNPTINGGLYKLQLSTSSRQFSWDPPTEASADELFQTSFVESCFRDLRIGPTRLISTIVGHKEQFGSAIFEHRWEIERKTGRRLWKLDLAPVPNWAVKDRIIDADGYTLAVEFEDTYGEIVTIPRRDLAVFLRRATGRGDDEGESALRPLEYYDLMKNTLLTNAQITNETAGEGIPAVFQTAQTVKAQPSEILDSVADFREGKTDGIFVPFGYDFRMWHGNTALPDILSQIKHVEHTERAQLDDMLPELGTSQFGGLAIGEVVERTGNQTEQGLLFLILEDLDRDFVQPIYRRNGWDPSRRCRLDVLGFEDVQALRVLMELAREFPVLGQSATEAVQQIFQRMLRRTLGRATQ